MNNIERIRCAFLNLPLEFAAEKLFAAVEKLHSLATVDEWRRKMDQTINSCSEDMINRIYQILSKVVTNMEMELKQHLVHLIDAPDSNEVDESIQPLFNFLQMELAPYQDYLMPENYTRYRSIELVRRTC